MRVLALLLALVVGDPPHRYESEEAKAAAEEGRAAFADGDYDEAIEAFARAYALEPNPPASLLYAQAQAHRLAGRCVEATPLYIEFLDSKPKARRADATQWSLSLCIVSMSLDVGACDQAEDQLSRLEEEATLDGKRRHQFQELEVRLQECRTPEPTPAVLEPEPEPPPPKPVRVTAPEPPRARPRVDPWGVALGAGSLLAAGAAVGLFLGSRAQLDAVSLEGTHGRARARHESGRGMQAGAIGAAAVAGGLAVGAVVHWLVWRKRQRSSPARATALR